MSNSEEKRITIIKPDDWHLHLRDGSVMYSVLPYSTKRFGRALIMPNLNPPVTAVKEAYDYRQRILDVLPHGSTFNPLMALYLTDNTTLNDIERATTSGHTLAYKLYPAGTTTNSDAGVTNISKVYHALERMEEVGMVLSIHGEVADPNVDVFDRERVFMEKVFLPLRTKYPKLRIVLEHITTEDGVWAVKAGGEYTAATITAHHLLMNRNDMLVDGIKPHLYCKPVLKKEKDRQALIETATSGNPQFFLGTDSAPHARHTKETACGCAGCFTAPMAIELYAEVFDQAGQLDKLEGLASRFGGIFMDCRPIPPKLH